MAAVKRPEFPSAVPSDAAFDIAKRDRALAMLDAKAWKPSPGDILTAPLVALRRGGENSEFGVYPILVFERMDGYPFPFDTENFVAFHAYHTIVRDALAEIKPRPADKPILTIKYSGRVQFGTSVDGPDGTLYVENKEKSDYENYTVLLGDGADLTVESFDWDTDVKVDPRKSK
jgi:hypothetical protein